MNIARGGFRVSGRSDDSGALHPARRGCVQQGRPLQAGGGFYACAFPADTRDTCTPARVAFPVRYRGFAGLLCGWRGWFVTFGGRRSWVAVASLYRSSLNQRVQGSSPCRGSFAWEQDLGVVWRFGLFGVSTPAATPAAGAGLLPSGCYEHSRAFPCVSNSRFFGF